MGTAWLDWLAAFRGFEIARVADADAYAVVVGVGRTVHRIIVVITIIVITIIIIVIIIVVIVVIVTIIVITIVIIVITIVITIVSIVVIVSSIITLLIIASFFGSRVSDHHRNRYIHINSHTSSFFIHIAHLTNTLVAVIVFVRLAVSGTSLNWICI